MAEFTNDDWLPRILLAEDSATRRQQIQRRLEREGHRVDAVEDGQHALDHLRRQAPVDLPDLVVSDIHMPRVDGVQLAQALRDEPQWSELPVILYTASSLDADSRTEARDFLKGAVAFEKLAETVQARVRAMRSLRRMAMARALLESGPACRRSDPEPATDPGPVTHYEPTPEDQVEAELDTIRRRVASDPGNPAHREWLAFRLYTFGRLQEAIDLYRQLVAEGHRPGVQHFYIGNAHFKLRRVTEALEAWKRSISLAPNSAEARKARRRLDEVQGAQLQSSR